MSSPEPIIIGASRRVNRGKDWFLRLEILGSSASFFQDMIFVHPRRLRLFAFVCGISTKGLVILTLYLHSLSKSNGHTSRPVGGQSPRS